MNIYQSKLAITLFCLTVSIPSLANNSQEPQIPKKLDDPSVIACEFINPDALIFDENLSLAQQGDSEAQYDIGIRYYLGRGVSLDQVKGIEWLIKASDQEHVEAQYELGAIFHNEGGDFQDIDTAKYFYQKSCDNGHEQGCQKYQALNEVSN